MPHKPSAIKKLNKLAAGGPGLIDVVVHDRTKLTMEDRAVAIIQATNFESTLEDAIKSKLVPLNAEDCRRLFSPDSPLGTLGTKINFGYALGIIGKHTRKDLNAIRHIRNAFAHSRKTLSFDTDEISEVCGLLSIADRTPTVRDFGEIAFPLDTPRKQFLATIKLYQMALIGVLGRKIYNPHARKIPLD